MSSPAPHPCKVPFYVTLGMVASLVLLITLCTIGVNSTRQNLPNQPTGDPATSDLPTTYLGIPVTPYPYNPEFPPEQWTLMIDTLDRPDTIDGMRIEFKSPIYAEIKARLPVPRDVSGGHIWYDVGPEFFDSLVDEFFSEIKEEATENERRWERREYHWDNIDAFNQRVKSISDDRVIDQEEEADICFLRDTWEAQLTEALMYVREYREAEPEFVEEPLNGLLTLEKQAIEGLTLLEEVECVPGVN